ncbi:invasion associated locus B family protein [Thalassovita mediterranea]|jgi:invasion protein IalB|uniref:Invasion protein B, involved in pathogenesis n=1 Tax=Thalassovita mediterranea TaxID=340021 RepID=A0A0P1GZW9_9RHOB|nr:invasion associated locus B family protein [Thalassovita mediterranea]CUH83200.1 Invasion protein B, involved in pathogenesis [Thalassovita mediterranea]SIS33488.1 Invasion protein IalB, involved in pathogenesis [Thalassovita mediterranea]
MTKLSKSLTLIAALTCGAAAIAQEATNVAPADAGAGETQPTTSAAAGTDLSLGTPTAPQPYIREESGAWKLECYRTGQEQEPCQLLQPLFGAEGNQVANVRIFRLPEGEQAVAGAVIAVPLETMLGAGLTILVDANVPQRYPFSVCDKDGCYARIGLTQQDIDAYKRGANAIVSLVPFVAPDRRVDLKMSLSGFTAGFDKVTATLQR